MERKKFNIIKTFEDDAPCGDVNWCTVSFLTPQKIKATEYLDVRGLKVHNGYNTLESAQQDAVKIKEKHDSHDVYLSQIGKIYAWDDVTRSDYITYDNEKMNELEKTRRENVDKVKLMKEQFNNKFKNIYANTNMERLEKQRNHYVQKLYERGLITTKEYEMMKEEEISVKKSREKMETLSKIQEEIDTCFQTDYLDENDSVGLKYGCITIYSPKQIGGLKTLCFKIRGLYQTIAELHKRIKKLKSLYPHDSIYTFEIGKWSVMTEKDNMDPTLMLKQLNYAMKCYLDNLKMEKDEFEKRKESSQAIAQQESKQTNMKNKREKRKMKRDAAKKKECPVEPTKSDKDSGICDGDNPEDKEAIKKILQYLDDPDTRDKFTADKSAMETIEMDI